MTDMRKSWFMLTACSLVLLASIGIAFEIDFRHQKEKDGPTAASVEITGPEESGLYIRGELCSIDGKHWWKGRKAGDGVACYSEDASPDIMEFVRIGCAHDTELYYKGRCQDGLEFGTAFLRECQSIAGVDAKAWHEKDCETRLKVYAGWYKWYEMGDEHEDHPYTPKR